MAPSRKALLALAVVASAACYRPNIVNGGLFCSDAGTCPEGFVCNSIDGRCYKPDAGPSCTDAKPHVTALCADEPATGSLCNPACQRGCTCGQCTVVAGADGGVGVAQCASIGTKAEGNLCNLAADDCAPGFVCFRENCGTNLGRCRKFCRMDQDCPTSVYCTISSGPATVCEDVPSQTCDPVLGTGCPDPLVCYVRGVQTSCECPGMVPNGSTCTSDTSCSPGSRCVRVGTDVLCRPVCALSGGNTCLPPTSCLPIGLQYGYCG
jgi:hypothetical protein